MIDTPNGATTTADAFSLAGPVAAGIFEYQLFRGGVTPDAATDQDWFLRSSIEDPTDPPDPPPPPTPITPTVPIAPLIPTPPPVPPQPPQPPLPTDPTPITPTVPPLPPTPITPTVPILPLIPVPPPVPPPPPEPPGGGDIPLIRPEIPGYVIAPSVAADLGLETLGTFHERRGNQSLLDLESEGQRSWARAFGGVFDADWTPSIEDLDYQMDPEFDGRFWGLQVGADIYGRLHDNGSQDRAGLFFTHGQASGDITANALGQVQIHTGSLDLKSESIGAYWTYLDAGGWYLDAVGMVSWLHGDVTSYRDIGADMNGYALTGSAEMGIPLALDETWTIEPQGQLILQHVALGSTSDPFSSIDYDDVTRLTGRIGVRVEADTVIDGRLAQIFGSVDLWHRFSTESSAQFNNDIVHTETGGTSLQLQAGLNTAITEAVSAFGAVSYETALDGGAHSGFKANIGFKMRW